MSTPPTELSAQFTLEYTFKRSLGPVLTAFFTALRDGRVLGMRTPRGSVLVPPSEYDPETGAALSDPVPVADRGVVTTYTWVDEPHAQQPLAGPFAYALVRLDGADTPLLHALDTGGKREAVRVGMRVRARWAKERVGAITDIACFVPEDAP